MERDNNPQHLHEGHFTAYVGLYPTFSAFISSYQNAMNKFYREVSEGNETPDSIALPILLLMRHTMELGYKFTITEICQLNGVTYNPKDDLHFLKKLHSRLKQAF